MNKSSRKVLTGKHKNHMFDEYEELMDMIEAGMEDYEIASELGMDQDFISDVKKELYSDMT